VKQLARIERREARLRRIRSKLERQSEIVAKTLQEHHHIGLSQDLYQHIGTFLQRNAGDPAIKVWHPASLVLRKLILFTEFPPKTETASASARAQISEGSWLWPRGRQS
jgi:hypothetical protein